MSKRAFDKIRAGLEDAIARGEADPAAYRVHVPDRVDVKAIRRKLGMSQAEFAASFGSGSMPSRTGSRAGAAPRAPPGPSSR